VAGSPSSTTYSDRRPEVGLAFAPERSFVGGIWRVQDDENVEWFWLRPHQSGNPDATQYAPCFNGIAGWQLYHDERYTVPVAYRFGEWTHVRIAFAGDRADIAVDYPPLRVYGLKREVAAGGLGVTASELAPAHFSRFSHAELEPLPTAASPAPEPVPDGVIRSWDVSEPVEEASFDGTLDLAGRTWSRLDAEPSGLTRLGSPGAACGLGTGAGLE
jgi:hypothetical protein